MSSEFPPSLHIIEPELAQNSEVVNAYFSLKNADTYNQEGSVPGLNIGFNTGDSTRQVKSNRSTLFEYLNLDPDKIARGKQVHSNRVLEVTEGGLYPGTDGLVTTVPRLTLAIQVADCAAVLLADKKQGVIAAVHAGWRGAAAGILENALELLKRKGAEMENLEVYTSPCISQKHFEVGPEVAEQFPTSTVDNTSYEKPHVDLKQFIVDQLVERGVSRSLIQVDPRCTYEDADNLYSYRREGEKSGRMFALIQLI